MADVSSENQTSCAIKLNQWFTNFLVIRITFTKVLCIINSSCFLSTNMPDCQDTNPSWTSWTWDILQIVDIWVFFILLSTISPITFVWSTVLGTTELNSTEKNLWCGHTEIFALELTLLLCMYSLKGRKKFLQLLEDTNDQSHEGHNLALA